MEKIIRNLIYLFIFLYPLFFLPFTTDTHEYSKMMLLLIFCLILVFLFIIKTVYSQKLALRKTGYFLPLFLISLISVLSAFIQSPNPVISFLSPLGTATLLGGTVLYFLLANLMVQEDERKIGILFILGASLVSLYLIAMQLNIIPVAVNTPAGGLLFGIIYIFVALCYTALKIIFLFIRNLNNENGQKSLKLIFLLISSSLFIVTLIVTLLNTVKEGQIVLLPLPYGWSIITEQMKGVKTTLFGVGPGNFLSAFTLVKPVEINSTPIWNVLFTSSSSYFFTLITESGLVSGILFVLILIKAFRSLPKTPDKPLSVSLIVLLILQMILPANMTLFITTIIFLSLQEWPSRKTEINLKGVGRIIYLPLIPISIILVLAVYLITRAYFAEVYFKASLDAVLKNEGNQLYQLQIKAIQFNPNIDRYHLAFSQTNLALANALSQKKELTDIDKQNIPKLVQQAIDQAKIAAKLNRTNILNWENLAKTYSSLITFAQDSDSWAIQAYEQRIALDPISPNAYLSYGGLYLSLGRFGEAEKQFRKAIALKSDFANGYYNLALSLEGEKKGEEALENLQKAKALVKPGTEDEKKIEEEIEKINQNSKVKSQNFK